ncbi:MAG: hypothetical protein M3Q91_08015, partial [Acidobacteriota bacterium]|nr:hypothetical protein [Acidobacteriota bacterium]
MSAKRKARCDGIKIEGTRSHERADARYAGRMPALQFQRLDIMNSATTISKVKSDVHGRRGALPYLRIEPSTGWVGIKLSELWAYRELLYFLIWRDVKVRYKQTVLGATWAVIQPLFTMLVFSLFFGKLAKMPSDGIP